MSLNTKVGRKRTRATTSTMDGMNVGNSTINSSSNEIGADSILEGMLARQSSFLQNNLRGGLNFVDDSMPDQNPRQEQPYIDNDNVIIDVDRDFHDDDAHMDDAIDRQKEVGDGEQIGDEDEDQENEDDVIFIKEQPIYFTSPTVSTSSNYISTTSKKFKKQRTISLPQLPHVKLLYQARQDIPRVQNNDELLHLTGSTSKTLDGNRSVNLRVIRSTSPSDNMVSDPFYTSSASPSVTSSTASVSSESDSTMGSGINIGKPNNKVVHDNSKANINNSSTTHKRSLRRLSAPRLAAKLVGKKAKTKEKENFKTDKDGHYVYLEDDVFSGGRFVVKKLLGQGTFGKVLKCLDTTSEGSPLSKWNSTSKTPTYVAVKVIRAIDRYREAAKTELRVLQAILENDPQGQYQCLILQECFDYKNHICIVTDLLGRSVYDFMCSNGVASFPGSHVQAIAKQMIRSVCFLHDLGIIHTDLKPENILLCDESYVEKDLPLGVARSMSARRKEASGGKRKFLTNPEIKIIDFGSAVFHNEYHPPVISTRHYRAPEIVLGLGWSFPCDIWSIACVLVELVTGESLYPIHENLEHMAMMQRINGEPFPPKIVEKMFYKVAHKLGNSPSDLNTTVVKHFDEKLLTLQWPEKNKRGDYITKEKSIKRVMGTCDRLDIHISKKVKVDYGDWLSINWNLTPEKNWALIKAKILNERKHNGTTAGDLNKETFLFWYWFVDLCRKMFEFDPTKRITARQALEHEWFNLGILDEGITSFGKY